MTQLYLDLRSRSEMTPIWTFGGNVPRAPLLLRTDVRRHLQICREELGLRHVRCHGLLAEPMVAMREDGSFDLANLEQALNGILDSSLMPFFGVSGMPRAMARDPNATAP